MQRLTFFTNAFIRAPRFFLDGGAGSARLRVRFGIWEDGQGGAWLLDSGYGDVVVRPGQVPWDLRLYHGLLGHEPTGWTPARACRALGVGMGDVRGIVLSHLHVDHLEGVGDPRLDGVPLYAPAGALDFWKTASAWRHRLQGHFMTPRVGARLAQAHPYTTSLPAPGLSPVDLPGHAPGHTGIWVDTQGGRALWAADAAWTLEGLQREARPRWPLSQLGGAPGLHGRSRQAVHTALTQGNGVVLCHEPSKGVHDWATDWWDL